MAEAKKKEKEEKLFPWVGRLLNVSSITLRIAPILLRCTKSMVETDEPICSFQSISSVKASLVHTKVFFSLFFLFFCWLTKWPFSLPLLFPVNLVLLFVLLSFFVIWDLLGFIGRDFDRFLYDGRLFSFPEWLVPCLSPADLSFVHVAFDSIRPRNNVSRKKKKLLRISLASDCIIQYVIGN